VITDRAEMIQQARRLRAIYDNTPAGRDALVEVGHLWCLLADLADELDEIRRAPSPPLSIEREKE
jgi:hypothetical protein